MLDVVRNEPPDPHDPIWQAPNLILTPHVATSSQPRTAAVMWPKTCAGSPAASCPSPTLTFKAMDGDLSAEPSEIHAQLGRGAVHLHIVSRPPVPGQAQVGPVPGADFGCDVPSLADIFEAAAMGLGLPFRTDVRGYSYGKEWLHDPVMNRVTKRGRTEPGYRWFKLGGTSHTREWILARAQGPSEESYQKLLQYVDQILYPMHGFPASEIEEV